MVREVLVQFHIFSYQDGLPAAWICVFISGMCFFYSRQHWTRETNGSSTRRFRMSGISYIFPISKFPCHQQYIFIILIRMLNNLTFEFFQGGFAVQQIVDACRRIQGDMFGKNIFFITHNQTASSMI